MAFGVEGLLMQAAIKERQRRQQEANLSSAIESIGTNYADYKQELYRRKRQEAADRMAQRAQGIQEDRLTLEQDRADREKAWHDEAIGRENRARLVAEAISTGNVDYPGLMGPDIQAAQARKGQIERERARVDIQARIDALNLQRAEEQAKQPILSPDAAAALEARTAGNVAEQQALGKGRAAQTLTREKWLGTLNPLEKIGAALGLKTMPADFGAKATVDTVRERDLANREDRRRALKARYPGLSDAQIETIALGLEKMPATGASSFADPIGKLAVRAALEHLNLSGDAPSPSAFADALSGYDTELRDRFGEGPPGLGRKGEVPHLFEPRAPFLMPDASQPERNFASRFGYPDASGVVETPVGAGSLVFGGLDKLNSAGGGTAPAAPATPKTAPTPGAVMAPPEESGAADWPLLRRYLASQKKLTDAELMPWVRDLQANPTREKIELLRAMRAGR